MLVIVGVGFYHVGVWMRWLLLLPPLLVYSILSLFSPRSPSLVYMVSELVGWGREKSKEVVPRRATPSWWGEKPNCLILRRPSGRRKYTQRYTVRTFAARILFQARFEPREQKSGSSRNLLFLQSVFEDGLLQHRDAFLKCTQGAQNHCACVLMCGCAYIHHRHLL